MKIDCKLREYVEGEILPLYDGFDAAHRRDHADLVIRQSLEMAQGYDVDLNMVYAIAAYHDTGLQIDRDTHHLLSGLRIRQDATLRNWFNLEQIETMAQAVEDHRASSDHEPRSIYGKIVAEADRYIEPDKIITRCIQFGLSKCPGMDREWHWQRALDHLRTKYGEGGYLKLWFPNSPNVARLESLRAILRNEPGLRNRFNAIYDTITSDSDDKL